jgi:DnaJ-class molecular chaperone
VKNDKKQAQQTDQKPKVCPECQGRGWVDKRCITEDHAYRCMYCDGKGFDAGGKECYACHGTGLIEVRRDDRSPCPLCSGAGVYPVPPSMTAWDFAYKPGKKR